MKLRKSSNCIDLIKFYGWSAIPNILTDVAILLLPIRKVWNLQMTAERKLAVLGMFLIGGL